MHFLLDFPPAYPYIVRMKIRKEFYVDEDQVRKLEIEAKKRKISAAMVVRESLDEHFNRQDPMDGFYGPSVSEILQVPK